MTDARPNSDRVVLGTVSGVHGVRGWLKVYSYTRPQENIVSYQPWELQIDGKSQSHEVEEYQWQGKKFLVKLRDCDDRDAASECVGAEIRVAASQLPALEDGQYYWQELIGMQVINLSGEELGRIGEVVETLANDVLVVHGAERILIPWVVDVYIHGVDKEQGVITVDWGTEP